ncbi:MAG: Alpha-(1,3)-fucosyltransferase FucT [Syntrophomonadaceae bacterium]|nr:Alpha-(1,3)-fucosyltransferase FucT [Bacillota bacterium]
MSQDCWPDAAGILKSELIAPKNWVKENHAYFKKIFTWNDKWVDGNRYIKYYWPNKIPANLDFDINKKNKLCTMVAGNKTMKHPLELYTERINAIRWFERYHPGEFDLYGMGWDKYVFKGRVINRLNKIKPLTRLLAKKYPSYKGTIETKAEVLKDYKFAICYENAKEIPGYITEKIFDCFFAGCVPVYLGAPNVTDFIPAGTFIDKENFKSYEALYKYIKTMPLAEYHGYLAAIEKFVKSDAIHLFSAESFADVITNEITGSLA